MPNQPTSQFVWAGVHFNTDTGLCCSLCAPVWFHHSHAVFFVAAALAAAGADIAVVAVLFAAV